MPESDAPPPALNADLSLLRHMLDGVPIRVAVLDRMGHCVYANAATLDFLGLTLQQLLGRSLLQTGGTRAQAHWNEASGRLWAGDSVTWQDWIDDPVHGRTYVEETLQPYRGTGGEVQWVIAYTRDLTPLKQQEQQLVEQVQALQRAEQIKAAIVDNALAAIVTTDAAGAVVEFNPAAEAMFGLSRAQALGRSVAEVMIPARHRHGHERGMERMARGEKPRLMGQRLQMHAVRADGSEFPIEMVLWQTQAGGQPYYTASINDTSEKVRAAEVIERQRDALRQSEKLTAMGSLLAGVAHELNNPLAIVMGRASLLEERTAGTPLHADAQRIHDAAERCGRIVRTFLNMARQRPSERAPVALNDLVRGAADLLQYSLRSSGVQLVLKLAPGLPDISADADRLGQLLLNLIVNAQQALVAVPAPRELRIETGLDRAAAQLWLRVSDNGPGVPASARERIFDPYFTTKGEGAGTGLGLSVSRSVARDHGGELLLEPAGSGPGRTGASFCLHLPLQRDTPAAAQAAAPQWPTASTARRVLVVDDEPEIADLMRAMLEGAGYEVSTAETGGVALQMLNEGRFDAVVSDLRMPDVDGAALWRELSQRQPGLARRMLFVTGDTLSPGAQRFLADAGCSSLDKPFSRADLLARVADLLKP